MTQRKRFTAPVWWLVATIICIAINTVLYLYLYDDVLSGDPTGPIADTIQELKVSLIIKDSVYILLLAAEAMFYWNIRRRSVNKKLAWGHVVSVFLTFTVLPYITYSYLLLERLHAPLHWSLLILAHLFFVMLLIDFYKHRKMQATTSGEQDDSPDILNEYEGQ